ncbi:MAG: hypothetical protein IT225_11040 [Flavobacteriales bacterium]|nr:hypothetical protein [Flavobacteriales bacterium]
MGKLQDKKLELAQMLLAEMDKTTLEMVEHAPLGAPPLSMSEADIKDLQRQVARIDRGEEKLHNWEDVKARLLKSLK